MGEPGCKRCARCQAFKPLQEFARKSRGVFQPYCRSCQAAYKKEHYTLNKAKYLQNVRSRRARLLAELRKLKNKPCADCGREYPYYVMDFDYREGEIKRAALNAVVVRTGSWVKVLEEIRKCDVVCANCHRERTHRSKQSIASRRPGKGPASNDPSDTLL